MLDQPAAIHADDIVRYNADTYVVSRTAFTDHVDFQHLPAHHRPLPLASDKLELTPLHGSQKDDEPIVVPNDQCSLVERPHILYSTVRKSDKPNSDTLGLVLSSADVQVSVGIQAEGNLLVRHLDRSQVLPAGDPIEESSLVIYKNSWVGLVWNRYFRQSLQTLQEGDPFVVITHHPALSGLHVPLQKDGTFAKSPTNGSLVIASELAAVAVNWLAFNQMLPLSEQGDCKRPDTIITDLTQLRVFNRSETNHLQIGRQVWLKDEMDKKWVIIGRDSKLHVLWEDGEETVEHSTSLLHTDTVQEGENPWPGEVGLWSADSESRSAIVQSASAKDKIITVKWCDTNETAELSSMEFDAVGPENEPFGLHRGEIVLISAQSTGTTPPAVMRLGESEDLVSSDLFHVTASAALSEMSKSTEPNNVPAPELLDVNWLGLVTRLDRDTGDATVRLGSGESTIIPLDKLYLLNIDPPTFTEDEDAGITKPINSGPGLFPAYDSEEGQALMLAAPEMMGIHPFNMLAPAFAMPDSPEWSSIMMGAILPPTNPVVEIPDLWQDEAETNGVCDGEDGKSDITQSSTSSRFKTKAPDDDDTEGIVPAAKRVKLNSPLPTTADVSTSSVETTRVSTPTVMKDSTVIQKRWESFEILETAPTDHYFASETINTPSRDFTKRLTKEYKSLQNGLPDNILVRAYEDRTDLLRCLIIGPPSTPYQDVPFLIDLYLSPDTYPHKPPKAYFHHRTPPSSGRINPNLYTSSPMENGKICLSILNTWATVDKNETWEANRSGILQVLVSIQGLVLVREPYYLEPGFEKSGTEEQHQASCAYSERSYILTRAFLLHALQHPIPSFENELKQLYQIDGLLGKVIAEGEAVLKESEDAKGKQRQARTDEQMRACEGLHSFLSHPVTPGGAILLRRTVGKLSKVWEVWKSQ